MWISPDFFIYLFAIVLLIGVGISGSRSEFRHRVKRLSEKYFREYYNGVDFNYPSLRGKDSLTIKRACYHLVKSTRFGRPQEIKQETRQIMLEAQAYADYNQLPHNLYTVIAVSVIYDIETSLLDRPPSIQRKSLSSSKRERVHHLILDFIDDYKQEFDNSDE